MNSAYIPSSKIYLKNKGSNSRLLIFCAYYESKIIGCMLPLSFKDTIYGFYAGSIIEFYDKYPKDLISLDAVRGAKRMTIRFLILEELENLTCLMVKRL